MSISFGPLTEQELPQWFAHVATVFPHAGEEYFKRHYWSDPQRALDGIFVARDGEKIVSTVRAFHRNLFLRV